MKKETKQVMKILAAVFLASLFTLIAAKGLLYVPDAYVSDALYQSVDAADGEIVVVGIDEKAIDELGPLPWDRSVIADAIFYLNSIDDGPAVIGIDVMYSGNSASIPSDEYLAEAASKGNVVVACAATYNSTLEFSGDDFYMDNMAVTSFEQPYQELLQNADCGHINVMPDKDGVIRHALESVRDMEGNSVSSFPRVIYEKYCSANGIEMNPKAASEREFW